MVPAQIQAADACGWLPLRGALVLALRDGLTVSRLDLRNSGDTQGDKDRVVGYGAWVIS
jgi:AmmeMemoRadiSam system protein B